LLQRLAGQDKPAISRCNEGTSGQSYKLPPQQKQPIGGSPSLMAWVRKCPAVNSANTNVANAEPDPSLAIFGRRLKTELFRRCFDAS